MDDDYVFTDADAALAAQSDAAAAKDNAAAAGSDTAGRQLVEDDRGVIVPQHTLWVGNVPANMNSEQLAAVLSSSHAHGTVLQVELFRRPGRATSASFALATCATPAAAHMVKASSDGAEVCVKGTGSTPRCLKVLWAMQHAALRIDCVPLQLSQTDFHAAFSKLGDVHSAVLGTHCVTGAPQGHGYVTFGHRFSAAVALDVLQENLFCLPGSQCPVAASMFQWPEITSVVFDSSFGGVAAPAHLSQPGCLEWEYNVQWRELLHRQHCRLQALRRSHLLQSTALRAAQQCLYMERASRAQPEVLRGEATPSSAPEGGVDAAALSRVDAVLPKAPPACAVPHGQDIATVYAPQAAE